MIIGKNANNDIYRLLLSIVDQAEGETGKRIDVTELKDKVKLDDAEFKNILGYLTERGWISADSIGGPLLYDEISLTQDGLEKAQSVQ